MTLLKSAIVKGFNCNLLFTFCYRELQIQISIQRNRNKNRKVLTLNEHNTQINPQPPPAPKPFSHLAGGRLFLSHQEEDALSHLKPFKNMVLSKVLFIRRRRLPPAIQKIFMNTVVFETTAGCLQTSWFLKATEGRKIENDFSVFTKFWLDITEHFWKVPFVGCVAVMSIPEYFVALTKY